MDQAVEAVKTIQAAYRAHLKHRYLKRNCSNLDDYDMFTTEPVYMIPSKLAIVLTAYTGQHKKRLLVSALDLVKWMAKQRNLTNPYHMEELINDDVAKTAVAKTLTFVQGEIALYEKAHVRTGFMTSMKGSTYDVYEHMRSLVMDIMYIVLPMLNCDDDEDSIMTKILDSVCNDVSMFIINHRTRLANMYDVRIRSAMSTDTHPEQNLSYMLYDLRRTMYSASRHRAHLNETVTHMYVDSDSMNYAQLDSSILSQITADCISSKMTQLTSFIESAIGFMDGEYENVLYRTTTPALAAQRAHCLRTRFLKSLISCNDFAPIDNSSNTPSMHPYYDTESENDDYDDDSDYFDPGDIGSDDDDDDGNDDNDGGNDDGGNDDGNDDNDGGNGSDDSDDSDDDSNDGLLSHSLPTPSPLSPE